MQVEGGSGAGASGGAGAGAGGGGGGGEGERAYLLVDVGRLHAQDDVAGLRVDLGVELRVAHLVRVRVRVRVMVGLGVRVRALSCASLTW